MRITAYNKILMIAYCFFVIITEACPFFSFLKSPFNETAQGFEAEENVRVGWYEWIMT